MFQFYQNELKIHLHSTSWRPSVVIVVLGLNHHQFNFKFHFRCEKRSKSLYLPSLTSKLFVFLPRHLIKLYIFMFTWLTNWGTFSTCTNTKLNNKIYSKDLFMNLIIYWMDHTEIGACVMCMRIHLIPSQDIWLVTVTVWFNTLTLLLTRDIQTTLSDCHFNGRPKWMGFHLFGYFWCSELCTRCISI